MTELFPYDLVIFDWDGTIVDSAGQIVSAMQAAITELELPQKSDSEISELIGLGLSDAIERLFPEIPTPQVMQMLEGYRRHWGHAIDNPAPVFSGITELLGSLRDAGLGLAVATGKSRKGLNRSLHDSGLGELFDLTRAADETASKPDPAMLHDILRHTGVATQRAVMIGDTEYDMQMATSIDMPALGVAWGVHDRQRIHDAGALQVCSSVAELSEKLGMQ